MSKGLVLVVEDEEDIRELIQFNLAREGYDVSCAVSGEDALESARTQVPAAVLLDLMLPGLDGLEVCKQLRAAPQTQTMPILIISAKGEEADIVTGLELGADDYLSKPFSPRELLARLKALLRRAKQTGEKGGSSRIKVHDIVIDTSAHTVMVKGKPINFTLSEFSILELLSRHPDRVFTRNQIIETLRGDDYPVTNRSIDVHIVGLRKKLGSSGKWIETVRGVGYRLKA